MATKIYLLILSGLLFSCSLMETHDLPRAYLVVDGTAHEMTSGTSCWNDFCSDSFAYITKKEPVKVDKDSVLELYFKSASKIDEVYLEETNTIHLNKSALPYDEDDAERKKHAEEFNSLYVIWRTKPEWEKYLFNTQESEQIKLKPLMRQNVNNSYSDGEYIISIGSWWADGDVFFNVLVQGEP